MNEGMPHPGRQTGASPDMSGVQWIGSQPQHLQRQNRILVARKEAGWISQGRIANPILSSSFLSSSFPVFSFICVSFLLFSLFHPSFYNE